MVTVRELARSQGFPDSFVFESINNNVVTVRMFFEVHCWVLLPIFLCRCIARLEMPFPFLLGMHSVGNCGFRSIRIG